MKRIFTIILALTAIAAAMLASGCSPEGPVPSGTPEEKPVEAPVECNWLLQVDQTIPVTKDGLTVNYTLVLIAQKAGGTDVYGTYEGAAYIATSLDASNLSNAFMDVTGGFDIEAFANNLSIEMQPYDKEQYSRYNIGENEPPLVPLVEYESMALISPEMTGGGIINPNITGETINAGYNDSAYGTAPITMKITVNSGKVQVSIPVFNISYSFEGLLTGEPLQSDDQYLAGLARIEDLKKSKDSAQQPSDDAASSALGGIMGNIGQNLPLPASFPADVLPLTADANIVNVYESQDGRNIRIMFSTNMEYEDILDFYSSVIDRMETEIDIDSGVMYMGSSDQYSNLSLMIMEDQTNTAGYTILLEVLKK